MVCVCVCVHVQPVIDLWTLWTCWQGRTNSSQSWLALQSRPPDWTTWSSRSDRKENWHFFLFLGRKIKITRWTGERKSCGTNSPPGSSLKLWCSHCTPRRYSGSPEWGTSANEGFLQPAWLSPALKTIICWRWGILTSPASAGSYKPLSVS